MYNNIILDKLQDKNINFEVSVLGENHSDSPPIFEEAKLKLSSHIRNWGYIKDKEEYLNILKSSDIAISTAIHEFYGVSMIESALCGCYILSPNRLSYKLYIKLVIHIYFKKNIYIQQILIYIKN